MHTKYSNLSDRELLRQISEVRRDNPLIEELAYRLENSVEAPAEHDKSNCPVCDAELSVEFDASGFVILKT